MSRYYSTVIEDSEDESGDGILNLPEEFLKSEDWREGDEISLKIVEGYLTLRNSSKEIRERLNEKVTT